MTHTVFIPYGMGDTHVTEKSTEMSPSRVTPMSPYFHAIHRKPPSQAAPPHDLEQSPLDEQPQCSKHGSPVAADTPGQVGDGRAGQPVGLRVTPQAHPHQSSGTGQRAHDAVDEAVEHGKPARVPP